MRKESGQSWFDLSEEAQKVQLREGVTAINYAEPVAADWPDLVELVERKVKPERAKQYDEGGTAL